MKYRRLISCCLSGLLSASLTLAAVPVLPVSAEEAAPAVFVITEFNGFQKDGDGNFKNDKTQSKYGSLSVETGTSLADLGLPSDLNLTGYWNSEGSDSTSEFSLSNVSWVLKSDSGESYSEGSPAGKYKFQPDLASYAASHDNVDEFKLADSVKMLTIKVTVKEPETEPITEAPTEAPTETPTEAPTEPVTEPPTEPAPETEPVTEAPTEPVTEPPTEPAPETEVITEAPEIITEAPEIITEAPEVITEAPEIITETPEIITEAPEIITEAPEIITEAPEVITEAPEIITETPEIITEAPEVITEDSEVIVIPVETEPAETEPVLTETETESESVVTEPEPETEIQSETVMPETAQAKTPETEPAQAPSSEVPATQAPSSEIPATQAPSSETPATQAPSSETPETQAPSSVVPATLAPSSETPDTQAPSSETPATQAPSSEDVRTVSGTLVIRQLTGDGSYTELRSFPDANDKALLTLKEDGTASEESITVSDLPCWTDLSRISLAFLAEGSSSSVLAVIPESDIISFDYRDASTQDAAFTVTGPDGTVFTSTIKITLTRSAHKLSGAECLDQTCSVCGQTFTASKDHTPGAAATCTSPQTCETCGTVLASALGHDWQAANCTAPKTCKRCHATEGAALGHDLRDDWTTASASTSTEHGSQTRSCHREGCDHKETRALNILGSAADNAITGLTEGGQYDLNVRLSFTAVGAAMGNTSPIPGDVRYVPSSWSIQTVTGKFSDNFSGAFSISKAGSYTVTVSFQKQVYDTSWKNTNIADSKSVTFRVGQLISGNPVNGTVDGVRIIPQTGDETPLVPIIIAFVAAILIIVGGIVFLRRRKR